MELPDKMTYEECYGPAMEITEQQTADDYFAALVRRCMRLNPRRTREKVEAIERTNLGYYAGYYPHETRLRVERLFRCVHPFLGPASDHVWTAEEAFEAGMTCAAYFRKKHKFQGVRR
ncbi:MAG: hypothetical protein V2A79_09980 [Planctomycetota bacterium]